MSKGTLTIYNASAGSGKTYTLTGIYLSSLFRSRYNYRKILAVTFTNKATAEMKSRILDNLYLIASGGKCDYLVSLMSGTGKSEEWVRSEAREILNAILHDYSRFSVSTIDSFFQKVLRAFTREAGLHSGFNIELDHSIILSAAIDEMIASAVKDEKLRKWLIMYALSNIDDEKSWNLKDGVSALAQELFREKFKVLSIDERTKLEDKDFLLEYIGNIKKICSSFEKDLKEYGNRALELFSSFDLADEMFYYKGSGVPGYVRNLARGDFKEPNSYVQKILDNPPKWSSNGIHPQLQSAISSGLDRTVRDAIDYYRKNINNYNTACAIQKNIYALGILSDVLRNIHELTTAENSFLLSDAGELLSLITRGDQCPFIYEKTGNRFENFMIDEFQDTSTIQWNNFQPLIDNSMAQGFDNLVVGDIKQSIYRWRNSDWKILASLLDQADNERYQNKNLVTNWRSRPNIISFNNTLFTVIPQIVDEALKEFSFPDTYTKLYSQAVQEDPGKKNDGYVRIEFIENECEKSWKDKVLEKLPEVIAMIQEKGYNASDIGIIVRDGREGAQVLKTLIDYANSCPEEKRKACNYNAVSNDSLLLSNSPVINFIISVLSVVNDPSDMISKSAMLRFYLLAKEDEKAADVPLNLYENNSFEKYFPAGYTNVLNSLRQISLFEGVELIIGFFGLGENSHNVVWLSTFQDLILNFTSNKNPDIRSFLEWWKTSGCNKSVILPDNQEAIRILTIHKSKGLEYKIVILPFLSWNLDHMPSKQPLLWVQPSVAPFNDLGVVPVRYGNELQNSIFGDYFKEEKYSVYLDNINLLYVALTRARDAIYGFSVSNPSKNSIAVILKDAISSGTSIDNHPGINLADYFNPETGIFEFGTLPENKRTEYNDAEISSSEYKVSQALGSLKLKLHGENYFSAGNEEIRKKINYGKLMHEIFEGIDVASDIPSAVRKLVLEGKLPEDEATQMTERVKSLIAEPSVTDWFSPENKVLREAGILLTSGNIRRPDRVIFRNGKTIIIDFKFGEENPHYYEQVNLYRSLIIDMGYENVEGFIWYVDKNKVVST
jgi:ATP-dependent exoDNAse (exonuclease V) beta subunit